MKYILLSADFIMTSFTHSIEFDNNTYIPFGVYRCRILLLSNSFNLNKQYLPNFIALRPELNLVFIERIVSITTRYNRSELGVSFSVIE